MRTRLASRKLWWFAILCGLVLRLVFLWKHPAFDGDTAVYGDLARNLQQHGVYGLTEGAVVRPTLIRLPGYPLFLLACFSVFGAGKYVPVLLVQILLGLGSCWLLGVMAEERLGPRAGAAAIWLACLCPFTAEFDALALTESLSLVCVIVGMFGLHRWLQVAWWRWAWLAGASCAFAVLLRPDEGLLAAAVVPAFLLGQRRRIAGAALASAVVAAALLPWTVRNWRTMHVLQPLAPKYANDPGEFVSYGFYRWYRTWGIEYLSTTNTYWLWDGAAISMKDLPAWAIDNAAQRRETDAAYRTYNASTSATPENDAAFGRLGAERARERPLRTYVVMPVARLLDMWLRPRTEFFKLPLAWWQFGAHPGKSLLCVLWASLDWLLLGAAAVGLRRWRWNAWGVAAVGFVVLRCLLLLTIDNSEPRYTLVCFPVVILLAARALASGESPSCSCPS